MEPSRARGQAPAGPTAADRTAARESRIVIASESRKHPRRVALLVARVSTLQADLDPKTQASFYVLTDARTLDVSDAGVGLEIDDAVPEGRRVMVELDLPDGSTLTAQASVVWSAKDRDVHYLGARFAEPVQGLVDRV
jgi:hypothetical protein